MIIIHHAFRYIVGAPRTAHPMAWHGTPHPAPHPMAWHGTPHPMAWHGADLERSLMTQWPTQWLTQWPLPNGLPSGLHRGLLPHLRLTPTSVEKQNPAVWWSWLAHTGIYTTTYHVYAHAHDCMRSSSQRAQHIVI